MFRAILLSLLVLFSHMFNTGGIRSVPQKIEHNNCSPTSNALTQSRQHIDGILGMVKSKADYHGVKARPLRLAQDWQRFVEVALDGKHAGVRVPQELCGFVIVPLDLRRSDVDASESCVREPGQEGASYCAIPARIVEDTLRSGGVDS
ncbi:hypothetical protein BDW67DRAFT_163939 [Aspergillus spinulosporus]